MPKPIKKANHAGIAAIGKNQKARDMNTDALFGRSATGLQSSTGRKS